MKIQDIQDIVRVIAKYENKPSSHKSRKRTDKGNSFLGRFDRIVSESIHLSDSDIAQKIYGKISSTDRYKTLKSTFIIRTVDRIASLDISTSELSEYAKAVYKGHKYLFYTTFLFSSGSRSAAIHFARRLLKLSDKYELHSVAIPILDELRRHFLQQGRENDYKRYLILSEERMALMKNESQIKALQERIQIHFIKTFFVDDKFKKELRHSVELAEELISKGETYFSRVSYYRLKAYSFQMDGDPVKAISVCDEAIVYMLSKPHMTPRSRLAEFGIHKLENHILTRDYENGKAAATFCENHLSKGMKLWFTFKEYEFLLMMQTMKFEEAYKIFVEIIAHQRFSVLSDLQKERWQLFGMNVKYALGMEIRDSQKATRAALSEFPTYRKDKKGLNVAILIINILVLLEKNKLDLIVAQSEALSSYRFKYLNAEHCQQSFLLFKLIRIMVRNDFDLSKIEKKSVTIEKLLYSTQLNPGEIFESIQVLPPSWVWARMKNLLEMKR